MVSSVKDAAWLKWMAQLMGQPARPQRSAVSMPSEQYYCLLDEQPTHLVPERLLATRDSERLAIQDLYLNPECEFSRNGELPAWATDSRGDDNNFARNGTIAWVRDAATGTTFPFWLEEDLSNLLEGLQEGEAAPRDFPADARSVLKTAEILVSKNHAARRRQQWAEAVSHCGPRFRQNGYVPIGRLLHPYQVGALRRYYRCLIRKGKLSLGDEHNPRRYVAKNEPVASFFHHQLKPVVAEIVGRAVKPSYVYVASYLSGSKLEKHTDREPCEFTINLLLDYSPEPVRESPWPLRLQSGQTNITVYQAIGDVLLYRGCELAHYRDTLPERNTSTSIFFHYVREEYSGTLD